MHYSNLCIARLLELGMRQMRKECCSQSTISPATHHYWHPCLRNSTLGFVTIKSVILLQKQLHLPSFYYKFRIFAPSFYYNPNKQYD